MNSVEIYILTEGQTEQTFVRDVLAPYMAYKNIYIYPVLIGKPGHKGGDIRFERAEKDICRLLKQRKGTYISTMFDYFRIDTKWPGKEKVQKKVTSGINLIASDKAKILEKEAYAQIANSFPNYCPENRFVPYISMHEFEALLFSDIDILADKTGMDILGVKEIIGDYNNPEEIDDDPQKAPSKRLESLNPGYRKVAMGKIISENIGIQTIREKCPHFNEWLTKFEALTISD
jgi:hypothetical protein